MRLTTLTDYAMRLLMYVGERPQRLCTISEIALAYGISEPHLMKVTHRLSQTGWIETVRGKNGGMRLAHRPQDIHLGAVMRDTENDLALIECFQPQNTCALSGRCKLSGIIGSALEQFMHHMDQYTLADILPPAGTTQLPDPSGSSTAPLPSGSGTAKTTTVIAIRRAGAQAQADVPAKGRDQPLTPGRSAP